MKFDEYERFTMTMGKQCSTLVFLQSVFAFRINELLSCVRSDLSNEGYLYVRGSKGSNGRIVYVPCRTAAFLPWRKNKNCSL